MYKLKGFYFITGAQLSRRGDLADVQAALNAGVRVVQYRDKNASSNKCASWQKVKVHLQARTFLVNDRVDIALAAGADGVHLGSDDMPLATARRLLGKKKVIGISAGTIEQARCAVEGGADYLGVGPIFATSTKIDAGHPRGLRLLRQIKASFDIPVVAIGGITLENAPEVISSGADALCAISAVVRADAVSEQIKKFQALFDIRPE